MSCVRGVRMRVKEGEEENALAAIRELAEASRQEPGNEAYIPCVDPDDPRSILFFEQYTDMDAFEAHGGSEHFQRLAAGKLWDLLDGPRERTFYETLV